MGGGDLATAYDLLTAVKAAERPLDELHQKLIQRQREACKEAGVGSNWTPRELRHTGISLLSLGGFPVEEIARIAGHSSTRTTEVVYRREVRPVITGGAQTPDWLLGQPATSGATVAGRRSVVA
jgi:integrase